MANPSDLKTPNRRERRVQRTRADLIDAAVTLCLTVGYQQATVDAIAAAANVSSRTFSRYFASKDAVFMAVLEGVTNELLAEMAERSDELTPLEALRSAHAAVIERAVEQPDGRPSAEHIALVLRVVTSSDVLRQRAIEYRDERVTKLLAERAGVPTDDLGLQLATAVFSVTAVTACARLVDETPPELLGPSVIVERLNGAFAQVAELAAALDPRPDHQTCTQSTSISAG